MGHSRRQIGSPNSLERGHSGRRSYIRSYFSFALIIALFILANSGCLDKSEGCIDAMASNFDVSATDDCCCEYPELSLNLSHRYGEETFNLNESYLNDLGQSFQILDFSYFISDVHVLKEDQWFAIDDSITISSSQGVDAIVKDDVVQIQRSQFQYSVGTFTQSGTFTSLRFQLGLAPPKSDVDQTDLPEDHILSSQSSVLYDADLSGHRDLYLKILHEPADTFTIALPAEMDFEQVLLAGTASKERGFDLTFVLEVDYRVWFSQLNLEDQENLPTLLQEKIPFSFSITQ